MPKAKMKSKSDIWITAREVARRLGLRHPSVRRVAEAAGIRRLEIPGRWPMYHAGDVATVRANSIVGKAVRPRWKTADAR